MTAKAPTAGGDQVFTDRKYSRACGAAGFFPRLAGEVARAQRETMGEQWRRKGAALR